ncbi:hypothetical protein [Bacillus paramycoides]|uniref:hypothetical protein n=1 Tax=Bacillus paramycoides TaxID=2026194 RepID=UPI002E1EDED8|nr:hypothetical protein [Bacillus paramycoides]
MDLNDIEIKETRRFDLQRRAVSHTTSESWKNLTFFIFFFNNLRSSFSFKNKNTPLD